MIRRFALVVILLAVVVPGYADSILVGSSLNVGTGCGPNCGGIDIGTSGGYEVSDRQRLAQAFELNMPVHVSELDVAISAYNLDPTQTNVFLTDALGSNANILDGQSFFLKYPSTPQVLMFGASLDLLPGTYYVLLTSPGGLESNPGAAIAPSAIGSLGPAYYANAGLGLNPTVATWITFSSTTVGFQLKGAPITPVPEPSTVLLCGVGLIPLCLLKRLRTLIG
jgi:hypothetical protein